MPTIKHILLPLDFSAASLAAIPYVRALASQFHAKVTLLSIVPPTWVSPPGLIVSPAGSDPEVLQNTLQAHLDKQPMEGLESPPARLTAVGDPAIKIAEFTRDNAVDLVMIPTHGHSVFRRMLLGSVTSKVLHDVHCPVWTAAHAEKQHAQDLPRKILCALDGSENSEALARWAADFSQQVGATLQLLHVVRPVSDWLSLESEQALQEELRTEARNRIEAIVKSAKLDLPVRIAVGEIVTTITEDARQEGADLIVLGRGAMHETLGRLRTHAHGIIHQSPCPVLSV
ncbi:MAG TPA: universal stress protein, partial [Bryobacteraceae bacterium]|nr:universal stress protein [Bryobacteraceae bacterium]